MTHVTEASGQSENISLTEQPLTSITDPTVLEPAVLYMFKRLTFASGELEMPCAPTLLNEHMRLIEALLHALGQKPPLEEIHSWRQLIATKLAEGAASGEARLVFKYEPFNTSVGLTGGFQLRIAIKKIGSTAKQSNSSGEHCLTNADQLTPVTPTALDPNIRFQFESLSNASGQLKMPCVPSMLEQALKQIESVLRALGQNLTTAEIAAWRQVIAPKLVEWFRGSPNTLLVVTYELLEPKLGLPGGVKINLTQGVSDLEDHYQRWLHTREGPLFGSHPDAKVIATAAQLGNPVETTILDVGAGTGRNSLALARQGYSVDALELTQVLIEQLRKAANEPGLPINLIQGDILDPLLELQPNSYRLVILSEVIASHFRSSQQVQQLMVRICDLLQPEGLLLFNTFLAVDGYEPSATVREVAQVYWSFIMTRTELRLAMDGLPLEILSDESVFEYEHRHLPAVAWPPTSWFINWSTGRNLFPIQGTPPVELRWVLCRRN